MNYSLLEACALQKELCFKNHSAKCTSCSSLINIGEAVLHAGIVKLADVYRQFFPSKKYISNKAVRHMMGMPFVIMKLDQLYVLAKDSGINYIKLYKGMQIFNPDPNTITTGLSKDALRDICKLASTEKDSLLIKYASSKASGKGSKKAKSDFGFNDLHKKDKLIQESIKQINEIKKAVDFLSITEDRATLSVFGICDDDDDDEEEDSEDERDDEDFEWISDDEGEELEDTGESDTLPEIDSEPEDELVEEEQRLFRTNATSLNEEWKQMIAKKRQYIKRKAQRKYHKEKAKHCLLKRKVPPRVSRILSKYPNIGKDIEDYVHDKEVGASAWRRTGVATFDGNRKSGAKVTFTRIQEHLNSKYGSRISYGSVVQLCAVKNARRISAKRYRGVARVTCRRARKGFNVKYNPDAHWSTAFYRNLDFIQLQSGENKVVINRDDQAGFRLDTTFTHHNKKSISLSGGPTLTARTDFVNSYPSILQTTSYLFMETKTTPAECIAVVKPHFVFQKNPAQHAADMLMLQKQNIVEGKKPVECIRVDGAGDEGPSHVEVQFHWTERHLQQATHATMVTTRHSGGSYLNKVELMNGCIAEAHANSFIPSTLTGSNFNDEGLDEDKLRENLEAACEVYMDRISNAPCMGTQLKVVKGSQDEVATEYQARRKDLLTFLKGTKRAKEALKTQNPQRYSYFERVWSIRQRHMVKNLPSHYIFALHVCYEPHCPHPVCSRSDTNRHLMWYPGGPSITHVPFPVPASETWGSVDCSKCLEKGQATCHGHYMGPEETIDHIVNRSGSGEVRIPPSEVLKDFATRCKDREVNQEDLETLGKEVLLPANEVKIYLDHLHHVQRRRQAGVRKAAETRRQRRKI